MNSTYCLPAALSGKRDRRGDPEHIICLLLQEVEGVGLRTFRRVGLTKLSLRLDPTMSQYILDDDNKAMTVIRII